MGLDSSVKLFLKDLFVGMLCVEPNHRLLYNINRIMSAINECGKMPQEMPERFRKLIEGLDFYDGGLGPWSDSIERALSFIGFQDGVWWTCGEAPDYLHLRSGWVQYYLDEPEQVGLTSEEVAFLQNLAAKINGEG